MENPYLSSSRSIREGEERPVNLLKNVGLSAIGGGAANLGSRAMSHIVPAVGALISKYVPDNIFSAGLAKLEPRLGKFMKEALDAGYTHEDVREFLGEKVQKSQEQSTPAQNKKNIIEEHSPELHQFIDQEMKKGRSPLQAGALAVQERKNGEGFKKVIDKLVKQHKTDWASILESVYGGAQSSAPSAQMQPNQPPGGQNPAMQQAPQQQGQAGQGQQALMDILSKINQRLGQ